jgi:hypothetical protein
MNEIYRNGKNNKPFGKKSNNINNKALEEQE